MTDHKNTRPKEELSNADMYVSILFVAATLGMWMALNLIPLEMIK